MKILIISLLLLLATPAYAGTPVIPECRELAIREGYPSDELNKIQFIRAKVRMAWLNRRTPNDPLVKQCHEAIKGVREHASHQVY